jgi:hypothetical protein
MIYIILFTIKYLLIIVLVNIYLEFQISLLLTKSRYEINLNKFDI